MKSNQKSTGRSLENSQVCENERIKSQTTQGQIRNKKKQRNSVLNSSENTKCKNLEDAAKVELRGKLIALSSKLDKSKDHKSITSASKLGNKEGQINSK